MLKVLHLLPILVRNLKFPLSFENSPLMSSNQQQGILGLRVFLAREGLVAYSKVGLMRMELLQ
jgi:hypothetical protein